MAGPSLDRRIGVRTGCRLFFAWLSGRRAAASTNAAPRLSVRIVRSEDGDFLWVVEERMDGILLRDLRISEARKIGDQYERLRIFAVEGL